MNEEIYNQTTPFIHLWKHFQRDGTVVVTHPEKVALEKIYIALTGLHGVNLSCNTCVEEMFRRIFTAYDKLTPIAMDGETMPEGSPEFFPSQEFIAIPVREKQNEDGINTRRKRNRI